METYDVLIIGSGLSGLSCAQRLHEEGLKVCVLDKGFKVGGRTASKNIETPIGTAIFDYGAQYFTVYELEFQKQVNRWIKDGAVEKWSTIFASANENEHREQKIRYKGVPTMRAICEQMANGLTVHQQQKVVKFHETTQETWEVITEKGDTFYAKTLVCSAPLTQSLDLCYLSGIIPSDSTVTFFNQQKYNPCIAILIASDTNSTIPEPGGIWFDDTHPIRWAADNKKKNVSPITAVTVHLAPAFSKEHFDASDAIILADLYDDLKSLVPGKWVKTAIHKWRYSQPSNIVNKSFLRDEYYNRLWFTGDVFINGRVESAWLAGLHTAEAILNSY
ncbi:FAD-dependent oxidoreductase [bacterium]|nr:MAG: FAD-dependent oxidoreductase [bacterium]